MYLDSIVQIPYFTKKITLQKRNGTSYVNFDAQRIYDKSKGYTVPKRVVIGKVCSDDPSMMFPNENYLKYFSIEDLPEETVLSKRSGCVRFGTYAVLQKIIAQSGINSILGNIFGSTDAGLILDLACYSVIMENNAAQYYPDYAYNHPLFTSDMHIYSDSKVSSLFQTITKEKTVEFLNQWNENRNKLERIYISYDSTNKSTEAGDIDIAEFGHAKIDEGLPVVNYAVGYDIRNRDPLFYESYSGSIVDMAQFEYTLKQVKGYGYTNLAFVLDRGYFSRHNIKEMDQYGYDFLIMVKGMKKLVREKILENAGTFENEWNSYIRSYQIYGKTIRCELYPGDEKERYFHLYHSSYKEAQERAEKEDRLHAIEEYYHKMMGEPYVKIPSYEELFEPIVNDEGILVTVIPKSDEIRKELKLCGYFALISSDEMNAKEAIELYKRRDASEKLFRNDKTFIGNRSYRTYTGESTNGKIFVLFIALIIRNRIYTALKDEMEKMGREPNYMNVSAAVQELEKIEMVIGTDYIYRMNHAITKHQKDILKAFNMSKESIQSIGDKISKKLKMIFDIELEKLKEQN